MEATLVRSPLSRSTSDSDDPIVDSECESISSEDCSVVLSRDRVVLVGDSLLSIRDCTSFTKRSFRTGGSKSEVENECGPMRKGGALNTTDRNPTRPLLSPPFVSSSSELEKLSSSSRRRTERLGDDCCEAIAEMLRCRRVRSDEPAALGVRNLPAPPTSD